LPHACHPGAASQSPFCVVFVPGTGMAVRMHGSCHESYAEFSGKIGAVM
jgi:hypothetical protein